MTNEDDIPDLEAPTECEDEVKVSDLKTSCASEARLSNERHEDHNDDVEPPISVNHVEVDYEFHNRGSTGQVSRHFFRNKKKWAKVPRHSLL